MKFLDLNAAVNIESSVRTEMTETRLAEMRNARVIYDQKMEAKRKEEEEKNKRGKPREIVKMKSKPKLKASSSNVTLKSELEPPIVDEATYIDIEEEYLAYEAAGLEEEQRAFLPENLGLTQHEVNVKHLQTSTTVQMNLLTR